MLYGLIGKYYPTMTVGKEYRPITEAELKRTSVYAITIESWSGIFEQLAGGSGAKRRVAKTEDGKLRRFHGWIRAAVIPY